MFGLLLVFVLLPRRLFSNLRTACSETLMLRERKASMAERSLSSLTGELLLLATAAAAFATFAARRLNGEECPWQRPWGIGPRMEQRWCWVVRGCGGGWPFGSVWCESIPGDSRNHHPRTRAT